jgi:6,7-dimethyl-8-ribityllumazine synthase
LRKVKKSTILTLRLEQKMPKQIQGILNAEGRKFAIVISRYNEFISTKLLEGALDCLNRHQAKEENITIYWVPGSFEIPLVAKKTALSKAYDAVICLGAVIRGGTPHFDYIAAEVSKGIAQTSLETKLPVIFGIITTDTLEQAIERAGTKAGNKGWDAALSAIEMCDLMGNFK